MQKGDLHSGRWHIKPITDNLCADKSKDEKISLKQIKDQTHLKQ